MMHLGLRHADAAHPTRNTPDTPASDSIDAFSSTGTHDAVEQLMVRLMPDLVRYFLRRLNDSEMAADCASNTVLIVWEKRKKMPADESQQRAWAFGVARRVLLNHSRKSARRAHIDEAARTTLIHQIDAAETVVMNDDEGRRAVRALSHLSEKDREILQLVLWDDLRVHEAGAVLGITPSAARKRYERALTRLRHAYANA